MVLLSNLRKRFSSLNSSSKYRSWLIFKVFFRDLNNQKKRLIVLASHQKSSSKNFSLKKANHIQTWKLPKWNVSHLSIPLHTPITFIKRTNHLVRLRTHPQPKPLTQESSMFKNWQKPRILRPSRNLIENSKNSRSKVQRKGKNSKKKLICSALKINQLRKDVKYCRIKLSTSLLSKWVHAPRTNKIPGTNTKRNSKQKWLLNLIFKNSLIGT